MAKEKKKSDWDNLQEMLSQNADDWGADETSNAPVVDERPTDEAEAVVEESAPKKSVKTKRSCGEKKAKATKARKKAAPKTDKLDAALAPETSQDAETLDLTVAESEKAPKKRRRTTKKAEDETELVKNVLKLEKETKAKKRSRIQNVEANPFVGLLSQIERVAQDEPVEAETVEETEPVAEGKPVEETQAEAVEEPVADIEESRVENVDAGDFFADFFADDAVEELEISWGRPRVDETADAEPESAVEEPEAEAETPAESVAVEPEAPRRRERRRRRREDRDVPEAETAAEPVAESADNATPDLDLNDLDAFFATDSFGDEGVGFAPRQETKKTEKVEKTEAPERAEKPRRDEEPLERPTVCDAADEDEDEDEDDEPRSKRKRRRRRGARRPFEDDAETPTTFDGTVAESETVEETEEIAADAFETERAPRDRRRRERRPRREARADFADETEETVVDAPSDDRRVAPERVLPSWSDAISHVVRFNMSRRVNRRR